MYLGHITLLSVLCVISEQTTFDKSRQNITDITVHTIPGATTIVRFDYNSITFVPGNHFKNLSSLNDIRLNHNVITDIADAAFSKVPSVTKILLTSNLLTVIREMMFSGLPNLSMLQLNSNQIHAIEPGSFRENTALTSMTLKWNSLQSVPRYMFDLDNHPTTLRFTMYSNPLQCDSSLCWLKQNNWITVKYPSSTGCAGPAALASRTWDTLTEMELCLIQGKGLHIAYTLRFD